MKPGWKDEGRWREDRLYFVNDREIDGLPRAVLFCSSVSTWCAVRGGNEWHTEWDLVSTVRSELWNRLECCKFVCVKWGFNATLQKFLALHKNLVRETSLFTFASVGVKSSGGWSEMGFHEVGWINWDWMLWSRVDKVGMDVMVLVG